jgi:integrase
MALWKRGASYWLDVVVHGHRYREPLGTTDWREAKRLERERVEQLESKATVPTAKSLTYAAMDVSTAIKTYAEERRAQVSKRMVAYWLENRRPLAEFFRDARLRQITPAQIASYQNVRTDVGRAPRTINGELSVLRQVLKRAKLWYRFTDEYNALRNRKPPVGRALTPEEQQQLFAIAQTKPAWLYAYVASTLAFYCGLRACEAKALRWQDVEWSGSLLHVRRSKTPAGWRSPTLNPTCLTVLSRLHEQAAKLGFAQPDHFVFPWHGRGKRIDPTKPMASWRSAWRSIRKAAGLVDVRFHDGRHTAITTLAEKGLPDWVIQAQVGHVAPQMMKTYSHIRRLALNQAAAALEPTGSAPTGAAAVLPPPAPADTTAATEVMSQPMSQTGVSKGRVIDFPKKNGSSGWIRTSNPPVNSCGAWFSDNVVPSENLLYGQAFTFDLVHSASCTN